MSDLVHRFELDRGELTESPLVLFGEDSSASGASPGGLPAFRAHPPVVVRDLRDPAAAGQAYRHAIRLAGGARNPNRTDSTGLKSGEIDQEEDADAHRT